MLRMRKVIRVGVRVRMPVMVTRRMIGVLIVVRGYEIGTHSIKCLPYTLPSLPDTPANLPHRIPVPCRSS